MATGSSSLITVAGTGSYNLPLFLLRTMLSESTAFQTWTGTANAAAALEYVYMFEAPGEDSLFPLALIDNDLQHSEDSESIAIGI